jgi:hypothetical protein
MPHGARTVKRFRAIPFSPEIRGSDPSIARNREKRLFATGWQER